MIKNLTRDQNVISDRSKIIHQFSKGIHDGEHIPRDLVPSSSTESMNTMAPAARRRRGHKLIVGAT